MADEKESIFDRAEHLFRRTFEKLGAKVDSKITPQTDETLTPREIGDILARLERAVDANLQDDGRGVKRLAPNFFLVLVTYERAVSLNRLHTEALGKELKATAFEYIQNRRYETKGPIQLIIARDLFEKTITVKAGFDAKVIDVPPHDLLAPRALEEEKKVIDRLSVLLKSADGEEYAFELKVGGSPVSLGRAAGNRVRIDDQSLSRIHCSFTLQSTGKIFIADLNSSNGTSVNGRLLPPNETCELAAGDQIVAGDINLTVTEIV